MSKFIDNLMGGFALGMLANNPFTRGMFFWGGGMYANRVDFETFGNPFPCIYPSMQGGSVNISPVFTTFANPTFPTLDYSGACQSIWDTYTNPDSDYNKNMRDFYRNIEKQNRNSNQNNSQQQYIPQIQFPFSSFYMPSQVAMNPWVSGYYPPRVAENSNISDNDDDEKAKEAEKDDVSIKSKEKKSEKIQENINISSDAKELKSKWSKKQPQLTDAFYAKVIDISKNIKCSPDDLMAIMNLETRKTFSTSEKNPKSTATGLIQFTEGTAKTLGTSISELKRMTPVEQLDYVEKYFIYWRVEKGFKNSDKLDAGVLYALVFQPGNVNKDVLAYKGTEEYRKNTILDANKDGKITKDDLSDKLKEFMA